MKHQSLPRKLVLLSVLTLGFAAGNLNAQVLGLENTFIHLEGPSQSGDSVAAYNDYPLYNLSLDDTGLSTVASFVAATTDGSNSYGSASSPSTYVNYLEYTYLDTADKFTFTGNSGDTTSFLGTDAAGVGSNGADTQVGNLLGEDHASASSGVIDNATGYIDVTTAGQFTFTITEADDQARVQVDGTTVVEANYFDSSPVTETITLSAGYHAFDLLYYQNGGGQSLEYSLTPVGSAAYQYTATEVAAPEPSSVALMAMGLGGLFVYLRRRRAC